MPEWLTDPKAWLFGTAIVSLLLWAAAKYLPAALGRAVGGGIDQLLEYGDEADDELVYAIVLWAERKCPEQGAGALKFDVAVDRVISLWPQLAPHRDKLVEIIERGVSKMHEEARKRLPPA